MVVDDERSGNLIISTFMTNLLEKCCALIDNGADVVVCVCNIKCYILYITVVSHHTRRRLTYTPHTRKRKLMSSLLLRV